MFCEIISDHYYKRAVLYLESKKNNQLSTLWDNVMFTEMHDLNCSCFGLRISSCYVVVFTEKNISFFDFEMPCFIVLFCLFYYLVLFVFDLLQ